MEREITDSNGITWTCLQAYSGLDNNIENQKAARVKGTEDTCVYTVKSDINLIMIFAGFRRLA
jgi:hypothetical protein